MPVTQPYWLQYGIDSIGSFTVKDQKLIGKAQSDAAYSMHAFTFNINGTDITVERPVQYKFTDPVKGELYEPFIVINPLKHFITAFRYFNQHQTKQSSNKG